MNGDDPKFAALDARLRRMMAGLDAGAGFEARVMQRVAARAARAGAVSADLRAQFERRREIVRRRLRREAWSNAITIAGGGAGGLRAGLALLGADRAMGDRVGPAGAQRARRALGDRARGRRRRAVAAAREAVRPPEVIGRG